MRRFVLVIIAAALAPLGAQTAKPSTVRTVTLAPGRTLAILAAQKQGLLFERQGPQLVILDPATLPAPARDTLPCQTASGPATVSWKALRRWLRQNPLPVEKGDALFQGWLERQGRRWFLHQGPRPPAGRLDLPAPVDVDPGGAPPVEETGSYLLMGLPDPPPDEGPILLLGHVDREAATTDQRGEAVLAVKAWGRP
ncbi:MAG TPA: hypothetical protein VK188_17880 [Holophaga sp.]|nr:hypothetical protein [Holophaga sp.]